MKDYPNERDCEHGQLRRSCPICAVEADYAALEARHNALRESIHNFSNTKDIETDHPRWSKSADVKIIATAKAHGASCIYSEDSGMAKLAEGLLKVESLPQLPQRQKALPIYTPAQ